MKLTGSSLPRRMAARYLLARKSHNAVNVISLISVAGVAVATAAIVCVLSVFNGFHLLTLTHAGRLDAPLKVLPAAGKVLPLPADSLCRALEALPQVGRALPVVEELALAEFYNMQAPVRFKAVPADYAQVVPLDDVTVEGCSDPATAATLSIGAAWALRAHPQPEAELKLYVPRRLGRINPAAPMGAFRADSLTVSAVYRVEDREADADRIYIPLSAGRQLLDYGPAEATALELTAATGVQPQALLRAVQQALGPDFRVLDREMQQEDAFRIVNVEKWVTFAMLAFILLIAAFNIVSTLAMLITEKERDISTLRTLGATPRLIRAIFAAEGAGITLAGGVAGLLTGTALCLLQQFTGLIKLGGDHSVMIIDAYPVKVEASDLLVVLALVGITALLTSLVAALMTPSPRPGSCLS